MLKWLLEGGVFGESFYASTFPGTNSLFLTGEQMSATGSVVSAEKLKTLGLIPFQSTI